MKKNKTLSLLFFLSICFIQTGYVQEVPDSLDLWYVLMKDKNKFVGYVLEKDRRTVLLKTESVGTVSIRKKKIRYAEPYDPELMIDGTYWPKYRLPHHNAFTPTGKIGRSYYQSIFYVAHSFNVRLKERTSLSIGLTPITGSDNEGYYFWFSPKFSIPVKAKEIDVSVGYWGGFTPSENFSSESKDAYAGVAYGAITYSKAFYSASFGLGYGMVGGKLLKWPFYTTSILLRTKHRSFLHLEILGGAEFGSFINLTARKQAKHYVWDFGWIFLANREISRFGFFGGPYISMTVPFGRTRL